jgi:DNA-binding Lrp family transcriptional regulator
MTDSEKKILTQLQRGIEPVSHPFQSLEIPEADVLALLFRAKEEGLLRRFGGIFDARRLGYKSILCALNVPDELIEEKAAIIAAHPGVTHCYERIPSRGTGSYPKLWFTLAVLHDEFDADVASLRSSLDTRHTTLCELPSIRRFKIDVVFDLQSRNRKESFPGRAVAAADDESFRTFTEEEKTIIRLIDQQLPLVERPFAAVAEQIGQSEKFVLSTLRDLKEQGVLRRIGAILYHRKAGFTANAMCVWPVSGNITGAGRCVAARPEVTHCYQRPRLDAFPFDLYAMIHTESRGKTEALFNEISELCGLSGGELFASGREFKKSSMMYFR